MSCGGTFEDSSEPVSASIIAWTVSTVAWTVVSFGLLSAITIFSDAVDGFYIFKKCYVIIFLRSYVTTNYYILVTEQILIPLVMF